MRETVHVGTPVIRGRRVTIPIRATGRRVRRLVREDLWSDYAFEPTAVPPQILVIPAVARLLPLAWAEGITMDVDVLDRAYADAIPKMRAAWTSMYPELDRGGDIRVGDTPITDVAPDPQAAVSLFSGGVDSTATVVRHRDRRLTIVSFWGTDPLHTDPDGWYQARLRLEADASALGVDAEFVRTNMHRVLDERILNRAYGHIVTYWWRSSIGLVLLSCTAPMAIVRRAATVYMASTHTADFGARYGSHPTIDSTVRFAGVECVHDAFSLTRIDKLRLLVESGHTGLLRVCLGSAMRSAGNCGECEKCLRTAAGLMVIGHDPAKHGIPVRPGSFDRLRQRFEDGRTRAERTVFVFWSHIYQAAQRGGGRASDELKAFLEWFGAHGETSVAAQRTYPASRRLRRLVGTLTPHRLRPTARDVYLRLFGRW